MIIKIKQRQRNYPSFFFIISIVKVFTILLHLSSSIHSFSYSPFNRALSSTRSRLFLTKRVYNSKRGGRYYFRFGFVQDTNQYQHQHQRQLKYSRRNYCDSLLTKLEMATSSSSSLSNHDAVEEESTTTITTISNNDDNQENDDILWKWLTHDDESYHNFTPNEANEIRICLLEWYRMNRRKLPWRGDAGPFDGSTAGINNKSSKSSLSSSTQQQGKKRKQVQDDKSQKSIKSFFNNTASSIKVEESSDDIKIKKEEKNNDDDENNTDNVNSMSEEIEQKIIPITGYSVWVSEIMLQQTRVEAVIPYYLKWMNTFPTVHHLANATEDEVNSHWAGLGFYRRARLLHKGAKYVSNDLNGIMPKTVDELMKIDGIGRYTASAIASIAFNTCVPVVDGNVCRVLSRLKGIANHIKAPIFKDGLGWTLAEQIVKAGDGLYAGEVNQAMMELGATYCAPSASGVDDKDPLKEYYLSTKIGREVYDLIQSKTSLNGEITSDDEIKMNEGVFSISDYISNALAVRGKKAQCALCDPDGISYVLHQIAEDLGDDNNINENPAIFGHAHLPIPPPKKTKREEVLAIAALSININTPNKKVVRGRGRTKKGQVMSEKWLMVKRPKGGLLAGQWEFPSKCIWSSANDKKEGNKKLVKKNNKIQIPVIGLKQRKKAMVELLQEYAFRNQDEDDNDDYYNDDGEEREGVLTAAQLWSNHRQQAIVINKDSPIEHIFSHVRHSMWIEYGEIKLSPDIEKDYSSASTTIISTMTESSFVLEDGREYKWMDDEDMKNVGITSAIKKILTAIHKERDHMSKKLKKPSSSTKTKKIGRRKAR